MGKTSDDLPTGVRVAVVLLRVFSYCCGGTVAFLTLLCSLPVVRSIADPSVPVWTIDLALIVLCLLATASYTMRVFADSLEATHSPRSGKESRATERVALKILEELLTGACFVSILATVVAAIRLGGSPDRVNMTVFFVHGVVALAAWMGSVRVKGAAK